MKTFYVPYHKTKEDRDKMLWLKTSYEQTLLPAILDWIEWANDVVDIDTKSNRAGFMM